MIPMINANIPAGASLKQFIHYAQLVRNPKFLKFDYGSEQNFIMYNQSTPPEYNLKHCTTRVAIIYTKNDLVSPARDVHRLPYELSNFVTIHRVKDKAFSHQDFTWAIDAKELVYDLIIDWMKAEEHRDLTA